MAFSGCCAPAHPGALPERYRRFGLPDTDPSRKSSRFPVLTGAGCGTEPPQRRRSGGAALLTVLRDLLAEAAPAIAVLVTIRSQVFKALQLAPALEGSGCGRCRPMGPIG